MTTRGRGPRGDKMDRGEGNKSISRSQGTNPFERRKNQPRNAKKNPAEGDTVGW